MEERRRGSRPSLPAESSGGGERVLIVEDEAGLLKFLVRFTEVMGYHVVGVESGDVALATLAHDPASTWAAVLDVGMGGMDGCRLGRQIVDRWPAVRQLYISGYAVPDLVRMIGCAPDLPLLKKPFIPSEYQARLRETFEGPPWHPEAA